MQMLELNQANVDRAERDDRAKQLADELSQFVNSASGRSVDNLALLAMRDHPTLLQQKMQFCVRFIELMSQRKGDMRTQDSEALAKQLLEGTEEGDRNLPLI